MKIVIDEYDNESRIDTFLANYLQEYSRSKIQAEIKKGNVKVNSSIVKSSYVLKEGDVIEFTPSIFKIEILPEDIPLNIIWEDENMLVVNKPSGMLTHPTTVETSGTLVNALKFYLGENLSDINGEFRRGILHRLDRNTSGLLMVAKNNETHKFLVDKMKNGCMTKKYLAIVKGCIQEDEFVIDKPIGRNPNQPKKMTILSIENGGKESLSKVKVLERFAEATLIEVLLVTGRTHQIRVHLASIGHPLFNDTLYGYGKIKIKTEEQVLESYKLSCPQPFDSKILSFEIPMDDKFDKVLKYLKSNN